jgi:hypothetical protein
VRLHNLQVGEFGYFHLEAISMPVVPYYPSEEPEEEDLIDRDGIIDDILHPGDDVPVVQA